jgi:hypothetical protein
MDSPAKHDIVLTRYLYVKKEVEISLLVSILNKQGDAALFWAFELYYSGFTDDVLKILWRTYIEFFATLNPSFEKHFLGKQKEWTDGGRKNDQTISLISSMVNNLISREFNLDVFFLREITNNLDVEDDAPRPQFANLFDKKDYETISRCIMECELDEDLEPLVNCASEYFEKASKSEDSGLTKLSVKSLKSWKKTGEEMVVNSKIVLLARILQLFTAMNKKIKKGKNLFLTVEDEDLIKYKNVYETKTVEDLKQSPRFVLIKGAEFAPDSRYFKIFKHDRPEEIVNIYRQNWLYYAAFSPIWHERLCKYDACIDEENEKMVFDNEDNEEEFYDNYGYEPEEQLLEIQHKNIPPIPPATDLISWTKFYNAYKKSGNCLYVPAEEYLEGLDD